MATKPQDAEQAPVIAPDRQFVHLHLHSEYSLLDGGNRLDRLVNRVKELGMTSVAVTDHGNLFGAAAFYETAKAAGIKPILGVEAYVAPGARTDRTYTGVMDGGYHLVLLAENEAGWSNLLKLCSEAYLTGFYYKPRIDREILAQHNEGLIAINGHLSSEIAVHLLRYDDTRDEQHWAAAVESAEWHARTFTGTDAGPGFYVELQHHVDEQNRINPHLIKLAQQLELPLVCDNDAHFLLREHHDAHDTLVCISTGKLKDDPDRMKYTPELYVKSPEEMRTLFEGEYGAVGKEALDNTVRIADRCNVELEYGNHAPVVKIVRPKKPLKYKGEANRTQWFKDFCAQYAIEPFDASGGESEKELEAACDQALRDLCEAGLIWRYGKDLADPDNDSDEAKTIRARLERELKVLSDKQISAYFLIVWDFVNWARQRGIPAGARGSGVGTMVGYVIGLSVACPVEYGLLFERFTDPDRSEYPDIDIDLCQDGRQEVIDFVREKYGHVAQIITFGTMKARAAIRDVGRVMNIPLREVDRLAKLVPEQLKVTIDSALKEVPELRDEQERDPQVKRLLDTARVLEGQARHASVHAAGVIVATRPLDEIVPLYKASGSDDIVTQWDGPTCERIGLLKMDFLGLRTLSVIERCKSLVRESLPDDAIWQALYTDKPNEMPGEKDRAALDPLDLDAITFDDQRVYDTFRRADTTGVFQFESGGMRKLLTEMKPDRLEDLIAANALYRPGPMDLIPDYNARKHGQAPVPTVHPIVDRFTEETYGVMVYQEQVMQIVHELGGIPLRAAYSLIKAISKKKEKTINAMRPKFVEGADTKGLKREQAEELFELILKFAGYGFNKSHSTGYAILAYQTALLKTYFPNQYMAAFLTYESQALKVDEWIKYKDDCRKTVFVDGSKGVDIMPPDINLSGADFTVVFDEDEPRTALNGHVRFGLKALRGAGAKAVDAIVEERTGGEPFLSLHEFCERVPPGVVNKATIESLICCGAFDSIHSLDDRAAMVATIDSAVAAGQERAKDRAAGQGGLFDAGSGEAEDAPVERGPEPPLMRARPWDEAEMLLREKEVLGFYISSHPLDRYREDLARFGTITTTSASEARQGNAACLGGMVKSVRPITTRTNKRMAIVTMEDEFGSMDCVLFSEAYAEFGPDLVTDSIVFLVGEADHSRGDTQLIVEKIIPVEKAAAVLGGGIEVIIDERALNGSSMGALDQLAGVVRSCSRGDATCEPLPMTLIVHTSDMGRVTLDLRGARVRATPEAMSLLSRVVGEDNVRVVGRKALALKPKRSFRKRTPEPEAAPA